MTSQNATREIQRRTEPAHVDPSPAESPALATELNRLETEEQQAIDRRKQEDLERLRALQAFD